MAGAKHQIFLLFVVEQYPADRSEADDDSDRDRPGADADVADGLPHAFILVSRDCASWSLCPRRSSPDPHHERGLGPISASFRKLA
jgi:hypothetical protein